VPLRTWLVLVRRRTRIKSDTLLRAFIICLSSSHSFHVSRHAQRHACRFLPRFCELLCCFCYPSFDASLTIRCIAVMCDEFALVLRLTRSLYALMQCGVNLSYHQWSKLWRDTASSRLTVGLFLPAVYIELRVEFLMLYMICSKPTIMQYWWWLTGERLALVDRFVYLFIRLLLHVDCSSVVYTMTARRSLEDYSQQTRWMHSIALRLFWRVYGIRLRLRTVYTPRDTHTACRQTDWQTDMQVFGLEASILTIYCQGVGNNNYY